MSLQTENFFHSAAVSYGRLVDGRGGGLALRREAGRGDHIPRLTALSSDGGSFNAAATKRKSEAKENSCMVWSVVGSGKGGRDEAVLDDATDGRTDALMIIDLLWPDHHVSSGREEEGRRERHMGYKGRQLKTSKNTVNTICNI